MKTILFSILILTFATSFTASAQKHAPRPYAQSKNVPGIYPEGSTRLLKSSDIVGLTSWDLKIMRNEIYARHGYSFKTQEMIDYFSEQEWYNAVYNNVDHLLTAIEKKNIAFIKRFEQ